MVTFERFSVSPIIVRVLFIKKLINMLNYNLEETFKEDKSYKKALKHYQISKGFAGNCVIDIKTFTSFVNDVPNYNKIWKDMS